MSNEAIVLGLITVANVVGTFSVWHSAKSLGYYTAWNEVLRTVREYVKAAPEEDLVALLGVRGALFREFDRRRMK